jgi:hypothetical protein
MSAERSQTRPEAVASSNSTEASSGDFYRSPSRNGSSWSPLRQTVLLSHIEAVQPQTIETILTSAAINSSPTGLSGVKRSSLKAGC